MSIFVLIRSRGKDPDPTFTLITIGFILFTGFLFFVIVYSIHEARQIERKLSRKEPDKPVVQIQPAVTKDQILEEVRISGGAVPNVKRSEFAANAGVDILAPRKENFAFNIELDLCLLPQGIQVSMDRGLKSCTDSFSRPLVIGMFHKIAPANQNSPFIIPYPAIEEVYADVRMKTRSRSQKIHEAFSAAVDQLDEFRLYVVFRNAAKGTKIALALCAHEIGGPESSGLTVDLYHALLTHLPAPVETADVTHTAITANDTKEDEKQAPAGAQYNPFVFRNGREAHSVSELADLCELYPQDASYHLREGHFKSWLLYISEYKLEFFTHDLMHQAQLSPEDQVRKFVNLLREKASKDLSATIATSDLPVTTIEPSTPVGNQNNEPARFIEKRQE